MGKQVFQGAAAIVTGAASGIGHRASGIGHRASGIGRALATELATQGAHVTIADLDGDAAERTAAEINGADIAASGLATPAVLDVRDRDALNTLVAEVTRRHGGLDLLFNNAGLGMGGPSHLMPPEYWDRLIDVNLRGVVNGMLAAYPGMVDKGRGQIVNTASLAGLGSSALLAGYAMTKHGVVGLSTSLRPEAALHGIKVNVLCPGIIETPILDAVPPADLPKCTGSRSPGVSTSPALECH